MAPDATDRVARQRQVAEFLDRRQPGRVGILAALETCFHLEREMAADLLVELVLVGPHRTSHRITPRSPATGSSPGRWRRRAATPGSARGTAAPSPPGSGGNSGRAGSPR